VRHSAWQDGLHAAPSKGVWRHLDRGERDRLLGIVGVSPASVPGFKQRSGWPQNNKMQRTSHG